MIGLTALCRTGQQKITLRNERFDECSFINSKFTARMEYILVGRRCQTRTRGSKIARENHQDQQSGIHSNMSFKPGPVLQKCSRKQARQAVCYICTSVLDLAPDFVI